jgi:hypothetical protein
MILNSDPRVLLAIGFVLVMAGWILPVLMVMQVIESTFFLNFFSYAASVVGLMLGVVGSISYISRYRKK